MLFPEGNCGVVFGCRFENHFAYPRFREVRFDSFEQSRTDLVTTLGFEHINSDDVAAIFAMRSETEAYQFAAHHRHQTIRIREAQVSAQFSS